MCIEIGYIMQLDPNIKCVQLDRGGFCSPVIWRNDDNVSSKVPRASLHHALPVTEAEKLEGVQTILKWPEFDILSEVPCSPHVLKETKIDYMAYPCQP